MPWTSLERSWELDVRGHRIRLQFWPVLCKICYRPILGSASVGPSKCQANPVFPLQSRSATAFLLHTGNSLASSWGAWPCRFHRPLYPGWSSWRSWRQACSTRFHPNHRFMIKNSLKDEEIIKSYSILQVKLTFPVRPQL